MKTVRDFAALRSGPTSFNRRKQANKYYKNNWKKKKKKYERKKGNATRRRSNKMISLIESQLNKIISASKGAKKGNALEGDSFSFFLFFFCLRGQIYNICIYSYCETL